MIEPALQSMVDAAHMYGNEMHIGQILGEAIGYGFLENASRGVAWDKPIGGQTAIPEFTISPAD